MTDPKPLIIVGASTRAAAQSAVRSGFEPWCVDQFGDADLREIARHVEVVSNWPEGIPEALNTAPPAPLVFTGALENSPDILSQLAERFPIAGASPESIAMVRDPYCLQDSLRTAGLPDLEVRCGLSISDSGKQWLSKPIHSAAGFQIRSASPPAAARQTSVFQEMASGQSLSGLFMASEQGCFLLGICRQLHGLSDAGADGFLHCGSIGPLGKQHLTTACIDQARRIGRTVALAAGLRGIFGVDFILSPDNESLWTVEVNPRWPASAELFHRANEAWPLIEWHLDASRARTGDSLVSGVTPIDDLIDEELRNPRAVLGRIVVYSPTHFVVSDDTPLPDPVESVEIADVPINNSTILPGHPVCTLLLQADTLDECERSLKSAARHFRQSMIDISG